MKNTISKIILISILLIIGISFSQKLKNKECDNLKVKYETILKEWEKMRVLMGEDSISIEGYEKYLMKYSELWGKSLKIKHKYCICTGDTEAAESLINQPPPHPPFPPGDTLTAQEVLITHKYQTRAIMIPEYRNKMNDYVKKNYPFKAKVDSVAGEVRLNYNCDEKGNINYIKIRRENPLGYGFGDVATKAIKHAKYKPSKNSVGNPISSKIAYSIYFDIGRKNKKCDSLKVAYEAKIEEWRNVENLMKLDIITKEEYSEFNQTYNKLWNEHFLLRKEYLLCIGNATKIERLVYYPPPPPPFLKLCYDEKFPITLPVLLPGYAKKMMEHIENNYPHQAKIEGVSCKVKLKWLVSKEGVPTEIIIDKEEPNDMGFGNVVMEAMKMTRFTPGKRNNKPAAIKKTSWIRLKPPK